MTQETPQARIAALEAEVARLTASEETRFAELARLTAMIEAGPVLPPDLPPAALRAGPGDAAPPVASDEEAAARIADLTLQLERMTKRRDAILASTSWRVTAPLRWVTQGLRRRK